MRTDYLGLEAFVAIAELGSFSRAASFLNLSQTALSHRIKKLEADLGVQLFIRSTRDVSLTKEAQEILPAVRHDLNRLSEVYHSLREHGHDSRRTVSFACLPTVAYNFLPSILREFSADFPDIHVRLEDRPAAGIYEMVQAGDVEFGISIVGAQRWDLDVREIYSEPYVLFVRSDHPLARKSSVTRADLAGLPFAQISTQSTNRQLVDDALGDFRNQINWRYRVQYAAMAMTLVAEGAAVTVLPALMANLPRKDIVALHFSDVEMSRTLGLITRRGASISAPARQLIDTIISRMSRA